MADLPPLVVDITGDAGDLIRTLSEVASILSAFADKEWNINLGINQSALDSAIADAEAKINSLSGKDVPIDIGVDAGSLAADRAEIDAVLGRPVTVPINVDAAAAAAGRESCFHKISCDSRPGRFP